MSPPDHDVCVVGAGPAGATVSYLLARQGWQVLLLEAGEPFDHRQRLAMSADSVALGLAPWPSNLPARDRFAASGEIAYDLNTTRVFGVGGTTLHWGALANRLHADDLAVRTSYGVGIDWPISYDALEPFYVQAERLLGVAGPDAAPFHSARSAPFPMPAFPLGYTDQYWQEVCRRVGVTIHQTAYAKNSVPYDGRPACSAFGTCSPVCPIRAQYSADHHVAKALETGRVTLLTGRCVRRLLVEGDGSGVTGVLAARLDGSSEVHRAAAYVVAAHAVESARLLLLSTSSAHPGGLGNRGDQVGRNLMEHWYVHGSARLRDRRFHPFRIGFDAAECHQFYSRRDRDAAGAIKLELSDRIAAPLGIARRSGLWGDALARTIEEEFGRTIGISAETEHLPYADSRITLHPSELNVFDDPIPEVHFHLGEYERQTRRKACETIGTILGASDFETISLDDWRTAPGWAAHHLGTCRMGRDPETSVVDPDLRIHGLRNAFLVGSAVFPTGGAAQPTLTIVALAIRLAEHLAARGGAQV